MKQKLIENEKFTLPKKNSMMKKEFLGNRIEIQYNKKTVYDWKQYKVVGTAENVFVFFCFSQTLRDFASKKNDTKKKR